jgi:superfamily II DNA or RNA helicase
MIFATTKPPKQMQGACTLINTYLGQKGYTISKSELTTEQIDTVKRELMVKPYTPGITLKDTSEFPVYRESAQKLYVPRYYGIEKFGAPASIKIPEGDDIALTFTGELRDYQKPVVDAYMKHVLSLCDGKSFGSQGGGGLLDLYCAFGKTSLTLYIVAALKKKTMVILHKEFLLNQWVERIGFFLPGARIGRIQGSIVDIENKDIVLCMLQSVSMKDYPANIFDSFGLTVIDEVHHISSEVFSRALFKIVTKYTIGFSATMDRKDGTTKVFKMFLGDVLYKAKRAKDEGVMVRAVEFKTSDAGFNKVEYDFRGNPKYSTMITKLCAFGPRSDFIVRAISDLVLENPENQIMVLCHNRSLLRYLHDSIVHKKIAPVGFYVGGMKQADLQATESMQIVLATYAMAAEALDIKTLSTLVMITPKTDITQSVGRILRMKHENPIIVDIVDSHDIFQNQWRHRKTFYKKCNYRIQQTDSRKYTNMVDTAWSVVFQPCSVAAPINAPGEEESDEVGVNTAKIGTCLINCIDLAE